MKKQIMSVLAAAALIIACAGCVAKNDSKKENSSAATTTTAAPAQQTTTTSAPAETTPAETEDNSGKTALITLANGKALYSEDGTIMTEWEGGFIKSFATGFVRISTGFYHDSITDPDLFDTENFTYSGDNTEPGEIKEVKVGDTFGGLTVKKVETQVSNQGDSSYLFGNTVELDGEITLTGVMNYYYDMQYGIDSGDILFTPDSCYKGLPLACDPTQETARAFPTFDVVEDYGENAGNGKKRGDGPAFISSAPTFRAGNLFVNYAGNGELNDVTNGGNDNVTRKVQITLTDIKLIYSDQFGTTHCTAVIKSIKAI